MIKKIIKMCNSTFSFYKALMCYTTVSISRHKSLHVNWILQGLSGSWGWAVEGRWGSGGLPGEVCFPTLPGARSWLVHSDLGSASSCSSSRSEFSALSLVRLSQEAVLLQGEFAYQVVVVLFGAFPKSLVSSRDGWVDAVAPQFS